MQRVPAKEAGVAGADWVEGVFIALPSLSALGVAPASFASLHPLPRCNGSLAAPAAPSGRLAKREPRLRRTSGGRWVTPREQCHQEEGKPSGRPSAFAKATEDKAVREWQSRQPARGGQAPPLHTGSSSVIDNSSEVLYCSTMSRTVRMLLAGHPYSITPRGNRFAAMFANERKSRTERARTIAVKR